MQRLSLSVKVVWWFRVSEMQGTSKSASSQHGSLPVPDVPASDICDCGHNLSSNAKAVKRLVHSYLVDNHTEKWSQRNGTAARTGTRQLHNGMDMAA